MYIFNKAPQFFLSGNVLDPNDVNANFLYAQTRLDDVSSKRYVHSVLTFPFSGSDTTQNSEMRSYRLPAVRTMLLEGAYLSMYGTGQVDINLFVTNPSNPNVETVPTGLTNPIISCVGSGSTILSTKVMTQDILLQSRKHLQV